MKFNFGTHQLLLICIGNEYRQDDGVGLFIGRHAAITKLQWIKIIENHGDGMAMIDAWKTEKKVVIVDAVHSGKPAGTIFHFNATTSPLPADIFPASTHQVGINECIVLARSIGLLPEKLYFYGIEGRNFGHGTQLSPVVKKAAIKVANSIALDNSLYL